MAKARDEKEPLSENYISIGLGILVVVVVGILIYNFINKQSQPTPTPNPEVTEEATTAAQAGSTYLVQTGDTLWSISEKSYGTGYNWTDIARANNITETDKLEAGQELIIPEVTPFLIASSPSPAAMEPTASPVSEPVEPTPTPITGNTYTVVKGDTLWDIACRAYGDCYAWVRIAEANKLVNPDLIHPGNIFTLPR